MARKEWAGATPQTTLSTSFSASTPAAGATFTVVSGTGYPTGSYSGGFVICLDRGTASEEKVLCSARSGNTFTVATSGRGWDGTTATSHGGGVTTGTVDHVIDGDTLTDLSAHVYDTTRNDHTQYQTKALLTTQGDIPYATAASTWARLAKGTAAQYLRMNAGATAPEWATLATYTVPTVAVFYTTLTWAIPGAIAVPSGDTDFIVPTFVSEGANEVVVLDKIRYKINSGTSVTFKMQVNGSDATGFTSLSCTTTAATTDPSDVSLTDLDVLVPVVTAVSGSPKNMTVTAFLKHTVTLT